jgi:hypothetical protein
VQIEFKMEGGLAHFPGLSKPVSIGSEHLSLEESVELEGLLEKARFFELPTGPPLAPKGAADYYQYTVAIEVGGRRHTLKLTDPIEDPNLQRLITILRTKAKEILKAKRQR